MEQANQPKKWEKPSIKSTLPLKETLGSTGGNKEPGTGQRGKS